MTEALANLPRVAFGDTAEMNDRLMAAVLRGDKTGTCWAVASGTLGAVVGLRMVVHDASGRDGAVVEITELTERRFDDIDDDWGRIESDGDRAGWRAVHEAYFRRLGVWAPNMAIWCARFRLVEVLDAGAGQ
jgi:uncharacterized protein YhfF